MKVSQFKPMLLSNDEFDINKLDYSNMFQSIKRDGVRAEVTNEGIKNRSLKILRNIKIQEYFKEIWSKLPDGMIIEAEIYADDIPCRETAGICNSLDKDVPPNAKLYVFGIYDNELNFAGRIKILKDATEKFLTHINIKIVEQHKVSSAKEATEFYNKALKKGFEGAVLMDGSKPYKCGRVTINQHIGFKLKPHKFDDLEIVGINERFLNTNESLTNELGRSYKRNTVDAKESTEIAGTFDCKMDNEEITKVTITGDEDSRKEIWKNKKSYIGRFVVVKSMDYGIKDKLRHPRMIKVKEKCEK